MISLTRVAARIFGEPLAIEPQKLDVIVTAIGPRLRGMPMDDPSETEQRDEMDIDEEGIATIDICGTLVSKASGMAAMSGLTSYADIADDYTSAMNNPAVKGILLCVDSPGGEVKGMFDLASLMYSMRGQKPVCAISDCAASAAYLLASVADQVVVSSIGLTGSIGIIALHLDESKADEQAGLKYTAIYAGDRKNDGNPHEPLSPEARAGIQARIDTTYGMFVSSVARNRGMSEDAVRKTQAQLYMGQDGVNAGLADFVGTPDDGAKLLSAAIQRGMKTLGATSSVASATRKGEVLMAEVTQPVQAEAQIPTPAEIEAMVSQAAQAARAGGTAEAALIANMCAIAGKPELVAGFLNSKKTSAEVGVELATAKAAADAKVPVNAGVMPGADASIDTSAATQGKAKPWSEFTTRFNRSKGVK